MQTPPGQKARQGIIASGLSRTTAALMTLPPARLLFLGYLTYVLAGWVLLALPLAQENPVGALDNLFIATSALSTTGLATVDPGTSYSWFGEAVVLALIQIGGLGYMTIGSFAWLALTNRLTGLRVKATRAAFGLPETIAPATFVRSVVIFSLFVEAVGAFCLTVIFYHRGVANPLWQGLFHSVSAFCTAGFSLFPTSLEAFRADGPVVLVASALSILGAVGFLIVADIWFWVIGRSGRLSFSSATILRMTAWLIGLGSVALFFVDPGIAALPGGERALAAFFQSMTASTTVGFDTQPIGGLSPAAILVLMVLMLVGASPAGTGGGLKTTSFAAVAALVRSVLRGRSGVVLGGRAIPEGRVRLAVASLAYLLAVIAAATFVLLLTERGAALDAVLFEVLSAIGTVGLSMGLTGSLTAAGKAVVILLMFAGRLGILTFGIAIARQERAAARAEETDLVL